jgi:hypothetical protein
MTRRSIVPPEVIDKAGQMVEDGASVMEITRTTGMARETILKHFPGASWSLRDCGQYGMAVRAAMKEGVL